MIYLKHLTIILIMSVKFRFDPPGNRKKVIFICLCTDIPLNIRNLTFKKFKTEYKLHLLLSQLNF